MRHKSLFLLAIVAVIFSSCRDKGSYEYSGFLLDSCALNPLAFATVSVYAGQSGDKSTTTNANGYFKIAGSWNEPGGLMSKQVVPNFVVRDTLDRTLFNFDYMPEGEHNFGGLVTYTAFDIPIKLDTTDYSCVDCQYTFRFRQTGVFAMRGGATPLPDGAVSGTIRGVNNFMVNSATKEFSAPIILEFTRTDTVSINYPDINVTQFVKLCGMGDTLHIKL